MRKSDVAVEKRLSDRVRKQLADIEGFQSVVMAHKEEFWGHVVKRLEAQIKQFSERRESDFESMTEIELKVSIAREATLKKVIRLPDECRVVLQKMVEENQILRQKLKEIKARRKEDEF